MRKISGLDLAKTVVARLTLRAWAFCARVLYLATCEKKRISLRKRLCRYTKNTSRAIVVINAAGRAEAIKDKACLAVRQESAAGLRGKP